MKRLKIFIALTLLINTVHGQINPYKGIYDQDSCKFESNCDMLHFLDSANNIWQLGTPQKTFFGAAYSFPNAVMTDSVNPYPNSVHTYFDLKIYNKYGFAMIVGFKHKYQTDTLKDGGYIEVSYDYGNSWKNVIEEKKPGRSMKFYMENMYSEKDTLIKNNKGFSGTATNWIYSRIEWVWAYPLKRVPDTLYLRFNFISDSIGNEKSGWIIDNLLISHPDLGTGIKRIKNDTKLKYYPNPMTTETTFYFENPIKEKYNLQLYNSQGQLVKTQTEYHPQSLILKRENLNSGLYFFLLRSESGIRSSGNLIVK